MKHAGFDTVIIQHLVWNDAKGDHYFVREGATDDATEAILTHADPKNLNMKVFVGLWNCDFPTTQFKQAFFDAALEGNLRALDKACDVMHYNQHDSLKGWYIPQESWNFRSDAVKIGLLRKHLTCLTASCRLKSHGKLVAFAPYFNPVPESSSSPDLAPASETATVYTQVLDGTKVDVLLLHDGVGAQGLTTVGPYRREYFGAFRDACRAKNVHFWANLECYQQVPNKKEVPTMINSLVEQFAAVKGIPDAYVTWDFFHFMNPNEYKGANGTEIVDMCKGGPVGPRRKLFLDYVDYVKKLPR
jgi:hypothetical protein